MTTHDTEAAPTATQAEENKRLVLHYIDEIFNKGNMDATYEAWDPDIVFHSPIMDEPVRGIETLQEYVKDIRTAFDEFLFDVQEAVADGEIVAVRVIHRGVHNANYVGIPATGRRVAIPEIAWYRVRNQKVVEGRLMLNAFDVLNQLGILPKGDLPKPLVVGIVGIQRLKRMITRRGPGSSAPPEPS
jgi:steroid delta-isomerase-like uncharacterized protein